MPNTIKLKLLENKTIVAEVNGKNYAYEGGYRIVAGEENATEFEIVSVPAQYKEADISLTLTNSKGYNVPSPEIKNNKFILPNGMAVAGYSQILFTLTFGKETVPWIPLKIKVWNTIPDWKVSVINPEIELSLIYTEMTRFDRVQLSSSDWED